MHDTELNWLRPGVKVRSLVNRSELKDPPEITARVLQHPDVIAQANKVTAFGDEYTIREVHEHPQRKGWFGIVLEELNHEVISSVRDPITSELVWEPVDD